jgi:tetratricopeptide (TPR) repeat protein
VLSLVIPGSGIFRPIREGNVLDIMSEIRRLGKFYTDQAFAEGLQEIWRVWERVPEPKSADGNAYMLVEYGAAFALKLRNFEEAKKWINLAPMFTEIRHDGGEVEFLSGKVYFEFGHFHKAKEYFELAYEKSEGRMFDGEPIKYIELLKDHKYGLQ